MNFKRLAFTLAAIFGLWFAGALWAQTEIPTVTKIIGVSSFVEFPGTHRISLTFDGSQAVVFWERGKASLFNVDDRTETPLSVDPRCVGLRSNPQQDGYFAFVEIRDSRKQESVPRFGPTTSQHADMLYFSDLDSLKAWRPAWTLHQVSSHRLLFFQVPGTRWTAVITGKKNSLTKLDIAWVNEQGKIKGHVEVDGNIIGLEQEEELHVYYIVATDDILAHHVKRARIDPKFKLRNATNLYTLNLPNHDPRDNLVRHKALIGGHSPRYTQSCCQQAFRLRASRPGDARRFATEVLPQIDYFERNTTLPDVPNLNVWDSTSRNRLVNFNQVAAFESDSAFELKRVEDRTTSNGFSRSFWNRNDEAGQVDNKPILNMNERFEITDAIIDAEGGIVVHSRELPSETHSNGEQKSRRELGISYFGNRIPKEQ